jgi:hypothetical protein
MAQSAVEWLIHQIVMDNALSKKSINEWIEIFHKAKEKDIEQRTNDYQAGFIDAKNNHVNNAENYVKETL